MRKEWSIVEAEGLDRAASGSLTSRRLALTGVVVAAASLALGVALASMFAPSSGAATGGSRDVTAPVPEIDDALAVTRDGLLEPAPIEHLAVVRVSVSSCGARSSGSGVVVAEDLILTAAHVIGDAGLVRIDHRGVTVTGEVLGVLGDGRDVALVKVDAALSSPIDSAPGPAVGEGLTLVGHPDRGPRTARVGAVAEVAPMVATLAGPGEIIGVDVSITDGMSGGPAVDADGAVVGLVIAKETATDVALVVALPDLEAVAHAALVPGTCSEDA